MKLKLYLRGLGIGLIIGALALMIFGGGPGVDKKKSSSKGKDITASAEKENDGSYADAVPFGQGWAVSDDNEDDKAGKEKAQEGDKASKEGADKAAKAAEEGTGSVAAAGEISLEEVLEGATGNEDAEVMGAIKVKTDDENSANDSKDTAAASEAEDGEQFALVNKNDTVAAGDSPGASDDTTIITSSGPSDVSLSIGDDIAAATTLENEAPPKSDGVAAANGDTVADQGGVDNTAVSDAATSAAGSVTITIAKGSYSDAVARTLADKGLVDNAVSFDKYLCRTGMDRKISSGTFSIPSGADYSTIASIITGRR